MTAGTSTSTKPARLEKEDIRAGIALMQTVYTIALVLGLETMVDASYALFFSPASELSARSGYLGLILITIILLAMRFFWVPRNLNSYIVGWYPVLGERVFRWLTMFHFPIALLHALLFYYVCQAFVDMTHAGVALESDTMADYALRFAFFYALLLLLNALWLRRITPRDSNAPTPPPGRIWSGNNFRFAGVAFALMAAFELLGFSNGTFIVAVCAAFIANSLIDLWTASKYYILYER